MATNTYGPGPTGNALHMAAQNARTGGPDTGQGDADRLAAESMAYRQHYPTPSNLTVGDVPASRMMVNADGNRTTREAARVPQWYNLDNQGLPVAYAGPTKEKDDFLLRSAVREAAGHEARRGEGGVLRTDPITDKEVDYLRSMRDMAELAKFDEYVETFIDPRQPGNMKFLMEVYPEYVQRRLQQAHSDYEFALRNQMIDSWGINTKDDLHFKYLVDQGKLTGPKLVNNAAERYLDDTYTPSVLGPFNFREPRKNKNALRLPFASAQHGARPQTNIGWNVSRENRPMGTGNDEQALAHGMYNNPATMERGLWGNMSNPGPGIETRGWTGGGGTAQRGPLQAGQSGADFIGTQQ